MSALIDLGPGTEDGYALGLLNVRERIAPLAFGEAEPVPIPRLQRGFDPRDIAVTSDRVIGLNTNRLVTADRALARVRDRDIEVAYRPRAGQVSDILGIAGPDQIVVRVDRFGSRPRHRVVVVDLADGTRRTVARGAAIGLQPSSGFAIGPATSFATDLWSVPTVARPAPETPIDQRAVAERVARTALTSLLAGAVLLALLRRRPAATASR